MRKYILFVLLALSILNLVPPAMAEQCPAPGPDFGSHIAGMTPDCPLMQGQMFGTMVNQMARGIPCPMHA